MTFKEILKIEAPELDQLAEFFGEKLPRQTQKEFSKAMMEALFYAHDFIARYPPKPQGFRMTFKSDKQRRYFFWALRKGLIQVPYRRTGTLGRSWSVEIRHRTDSIRGILGNIRPYAIYVQDEDHQAVVHRGRWPTIQQLQRTPRKRMINFFLQALDRLANYYNKIYGGGSPG